MRPLLWDINDLFAYLFVFKLGGGFSHQYRCDCNALQRSQYPMIKLGVLSGENCIGRMQLNIHAVEARLRD